MNYLVAIQKHFVRHGNEESASKMAQYMKGHFQFLGIKSPERKQLLREFIKQNGLPTRANIEDVLIGLWSLPYREYQYCAMEIADRTLKKSESTDIYVIEYMLEHKQWWDTVDFIAATLVGRIFSRFDDIELRYFNKWNEANDLWLNRTALIFQLKFKEKVDEELLTKAIEAHITSKEFFHQKAIGWALRQYSKFNPDWVRHFIESHSKLSNLSVKEGSRYL